MWLIIQVEGIPSDDQMLTFGGVPLEDDMMVDQCVPQLGTVFISARVVGGGH